MYQVQTIQVTRPTGYTFTDKKDFLEAQALAQKEISKYIKYKNFCKKANALRKKT